MIVTLDGKVFSEIVKNSVRVATAADCISLIKENP